MNKREISEIKRLFTPSNCSISRICGCYVDKEKNKTSQWKDAFLSLPEEEMFKYFEILRKSLSGSIGKNLMNLDFPLVSEVSGGTQERLLRLRDSQLKDEKLLEQFYDQIIDTYEYAGNYLILMIYDAYDIPGKARDNVSMEDASDEVYRYVLCCICPVDLSKPGLSYNEAEHTFQNRTRDWVVAMPEVGFLFSAFNDRTADIHSALYYSKNLKGCHDNFADQILGCPIPLAADVQKESFQAIIEETLGDSCSYERIRSIYETINELVEAQKDAPDPLILDKYQVKNILESSGVEEALLNDFDNNYDEIVGEKSSFLATNVVNARSFEVKTPDVILKVNPETTSLVRMKEIDGRRCLVIEVDGNTKVDGILVR